MMLSARAEGSCFNPRSPRGGATIMLGDATNLTSVSIHAPHEGERLAGWPKSTLCTKVSIHAPHEGERPDGADNVADLAHVSIHAPHEGERLQRRGQPQHGRHVSIHAPHEGERRIHAGWWLAVSQFQSTLPTRGSDIRAIPYRKGGMRFNPRSPRGGATSAHHSQKHDKSVSIHAPHEGERRFWF